MRLKTSSTMSQFEIAPLRASPKTSFARDDGAGRREVVDRQFELSEVALRNAHPAAKHGKFVRARRRHVARVGDEDGDVEPVGQLSPASIARSSRP